MKNLIIAFLLTAIPIVAFSADTPPSNEAISELLIVMKSEEQMKDARRTARKAIDAAIESAKKGRTISDSDTKILNEMRVRMLTVMDDVFTWRRFEPMMRTIYQGSFSATEVAGMTEFYQSDVGKAVIAKMPVVLESTMSQMMQLMAELLPKFREIQESTIKKLDETNRK